MDDNLPKPRRWFRFSLRTMLVVVTVGCIFLGWLTSRLTWIRARNQLFYAEAHWVSNVDHRFRTNWLLIDKSIRAPGMLWLFGERGRPKIEIMNGTDDEVQLAKNLFPEAEIETYHVKSPASYLFPKPRYYLFR
jgi:hypothetical protein